MIEVSVVMSVFNADASLPATLDSVLGQCGDELEFIVIDDGSTDGSAGVLQVRAAADPRLRVVQQDNSGLTRALIRGCGLARGEFIARQDADDVSLPGRFAAQCARLRAEPSLVAVAGGTRYVAPGGEWLHDLPAPAVITADIEGGVFAFPPLAGACFRRSAYERAGGFRETFVVGQDVDLWMRLIEQGPCAGIAENHYQTTLTPGGITSRRRPEQMRFGALALACARRRREGLDDRPLLEAFVAPARAAKRRSPLRDRAAFHYFVASLLRGHDRAAARRYYDLALSENPLHLKALVRRFLL
jgi:glycosyltransferase involved in cell wall biosynthesis